MSARVSGPVVTRDSRDGQLRGPNFVANGTLYLVRCFACEWTIGRENWMPMVASGSCAWCGWTDPEAGAA